MHALVAEKPNSLAFAENWAIAPPRSNQIHVKVSACGLNFADLLMVEGTYQDTPEVPFVPGMEICGEILSKGDAVAGFFPGNRIGAFCGSGGLAQEIVLDADRCYSIADSMSDEVAAGFPIAYGTSHLALFHRARLKPGETLVVLGAAGGVGLTAVELGAAAGARVIAVARGAEKLAIAKGAGAAEVVDAETEDMRDVLKALGPINVVYDAVGGKLGQAAFRALAPEGRFLVIGFASGDVPDIKLNHALVKNIDLIGFYWGGYLKFDPKPLTDSLTELMKWHADGRIKPHIGNVLPFERALDGLDLLRTRKATGKVVIKL